VASLSQIMPEKEAETYHINPFDLTKVWATQVLSPR
jgi:catalase